MSKPKGIQFSSDRQGNTEISIDDWEHRDGLLPIIITTWAERNNAEIKMGKRFVDGQSKEADLQRQGIGMTQDDVLDHNDWMQSRPTWNVRYYIASSAQAKIESGLIFKLLMWSKSDYSDRYQQKANELKTLGYTDDDINSIPKQ